MLISNGINYTGVIEDIFEYGLYMITASPDNSDKVSEHSFQLDTLAFLMEMMRADARVSIVREETLLPVLSLLLRYAPSQRQFREMSDLG